MSIATILATVFNYVVIGIIIKCMFNLMDRSLSFFVSDALFISKPWSRMIMVFIELKLIVPGRRNGQKTVQGTPDNWKNLNRIYFSVWQSGDSNFQRLQTQRIYKSLVVILFIIVFFTLAGVVCSQFVIPLLSNDPEMRFLYVRLFAQLITISGAINAPVLYFCR